MRVAFDWTQIHARTPEVAFPPLLLGCALCLWGYAVELLEVAVTIALAYELAPLVPWRWRFTGRDFNRLVDLSAVLFVVVAIYQFDQRSAHGVYGVLQWLPALLALLLLCQRFSVAQGIPLAALFLSVRRAATRGHERADRSIDFAFPFFPACLLSTAAGPQAGKVDISSLCDIDSLGTLVSPQSPPQCAGVVVHEGCCDCWWLCYAIRNEGGAPRN